jgi:hypothetical protein
MEDNKPNPISERKQALIIETGEVPLKSYRERIEICEACENFVSLTKQCKKCFCFMPIKARFIGMKGPIDKW